MRINTKFPMAVHILAVIALNKDESLPSTSELIAKSVGTNPVVIRRISSQLKAAGLISTKAGVAGAKLNREMKAISLLDIYRAVQDEADAAVFDVHQNPSQRCWIGCNIHAAMEDPLGQAQDALEKTLASYSLYDVATDIRKRAGRA